MFDVTKSPIDLETLLRETTTEEDGGVVLFVGRVRRHSSGGTVVWVEYEAYPEMVIESFQKIAEETRTQWRVEQLSIVHRVGRLLVGNIAVAVVAASPHRKEAFEACRYAITRVKEISPIWKRELTQDGCVWVDGCPNEALEVGGV